MHRTELMTIASHAAERNFQSEILIFLESNETNGCQWKTALGITALANYVSSCKKIKFEDGMKDNLFCSPDPRGVA